MAILLNQNHRGPLFEQHKERPTSSLFQWLPPGSAQDPPGEPALRAHMQHTGEGARGRLAPPHSLWPDEGLLLLEASEPLWEVG